MVIDKSSHLFWEEDVDVEQRPIAGHHVSSQVEEVHCGAGINLEPSVKVNLWKIILESEKVDP